MLLAPPPAFVAGAVELMPPTLLEDVYGLDEDDVVPKTAPENSL